MRMRMNNMVTAEQRRVAVFMYLYIVSVLSYISKFFPYYKPNLRSSKLLTSTIARVRNSAVCARGSQVNVFIFTPGSTGLRLSVKKKALSVRTKRRNLICVARCCCLCIRMAVSHIAMYIIQRAVRVLRRVNTLHTLRSVGYR